MSAVWFVALVLSAFICSIQSEPSDYDQDKDYDNHAPPDCDEEEVLVQGECLEAQRRGFQMSKHRRMLAQKMAQLRNVVQVPPTCPPGEEYSNGQCKEVWRNGFEMSAHRRVDSSACQQTPKEKHCLIEYAVKDRWPHTQRYVYNWNTHSCFEISWADHCPAVPSPPTTNNFASEQECLDQCSGWA